MGNVAKGREREREERDYFSSDMCMDVCIDILVWVTNLDGAKHRDFSSPQTFDMIPLA